MTTPKQEPQRNWVEDYSHQYQNTCIECGQLFLGHKRRSICKLCFAKPANPQEESCNRCGFVHPEGMCHKDEEPQEEKVELPPLEYKNVMVCHPEAQRKYGGNLTQYQGDFLIQRENQLREALDTIQQKDEQFKNILDREYRWIDRYEAAESSLAALKHELKSICALYKVLGLDKSQPRLFAKLEELSK